MPPYEYLEWSLDGSVAIVYMNRPPVNAVNDRMYREFTDLFTSIERLLPDARCIVLAGKGDHFSAGHELGEFATMTGSNSVSRMRAVREAFWSIRDCPLPVIAAVRGSALGTGLALAASCDLIVATPDAQFGTPEIGVGVMGGAKHLSRLVPEGVVRRLFLTGRSMSADELVQYGGVAEVVSRDELLRSAIALAKGVVCHSRVAITTAKHALNSIEYMDLKSGYELEQSLTTQLADHPDAREACKAVLERREARYANA